VQQVKARFAGDATASNGSHQGASRESFFDGGGKAGDASDPRFDPEYFFDAFCVHGHAAYPLMQG
jgi:hypothetical protein